MTVDRWLNRLANAFLYGMVLGILLIILFAVLREGHA